MLKLKNGYGYTHDRFLLENRGLIIEIFLNILVNN